MSTVGVAELRQNLSKYLQLVAKGERLVVTDRNRPVAELGPPPSDDTHIDRLIAEGKVRPPRRRGSLGDITPIDDGGDPYALSKALEYVRGDR